METKIVGFDAEELIEAIRKRKVVAFPTETVYGLGVIADSPYAYENLVEIKKRRPDKPFTLMLSSVEEIGKYAVIDEKRKESSMNSCREKSRCSFRRKKALRHGFGWIRPISAFASAEVGRFPE